MTNLGGGTIGGDEPASGPESDATLPVAEPPTMKAADPDEITSIEPQPSPTSRTPPNPPPVRKKPPEPDRAPTTRLDIKIDIPNGMVGKPYAAALTLRVLNSSELPPKYRPDDVTLVPRRVEGLEALGLHAEADGSELRVTGKPTAAGDHKLTVHFSVLLRGTQWTEGEKEFTLTLNPDPRSLWKEIEPDQSQPFRRAHVSHERKVGDSVLIAASRRGRSHANKGDHRDDDFQLANSSKCGWSIIAVADGAGSAPVSRRGAEIACMSSIEFLKPYLTATVDGAFHGLISAHAKGNETARESIDAALYDWLGGGGRAAFEAIVNEAATHNRRPEDFATTLILTIARKYDFGWFVAAIAVGDGGVGAYSKGGEVKILNSPDSGEYAGQTRFLTMPKIWADDADVRARIRFAIVPDLLAVVAMTDGVSDPKFPTERDFFDSAKWGVFWADLSAEVGLTKANDKADSELLDWLNFWAVGSHDDRTLAILLP